MRIIGDDSQAEISAWFEIGLAPEQITIPVVALAASGIAEKPVPVPYRARKSNSEYTLDDWG